MTDLESRKAEIEARLKDATEHPVLIHSNMADHYRDQIASLRDALTDEHAHAQASDLILSCSCSFSASWRRPLFEQATTSVQPVICVSAP